MVSGKDEDKFALCGFTAVPAEKVNAPIIAECPINLECHTRQVMHLGVHDVFVADVVELLADDDIVIGGNRVDDERFKPLVYATGPRHYHATSRIEGAFYGFSKSKRSPWEKG